MTRVVGRQPESAIGLRPSLPTFEPAPPRSAEPPPESRPKRSVVPSWPYVVVFLLVVALGMMLWWTA